MNKVRADDAGSTLGKKKKKKKQARVFWLYLIASLYTRRAHSSGDFDFNVPERSNVIKTFPPTPATTLLFKYFSAQRLCCCVCVHKTQDAEADLYASRII